MKHTIIKRLKHIVILAFFITGFVSSQYAHAQKKEEKSNSKIKIKVQTQENGDTKTFEKEYNSREELENDPEYKEFFGNKHSGFFNFGEEGHGFNFNLDTDSFSFEGLDSAKMGDKGTRFFFRTPDGDHSVMKLDSLPGTGFSFSFSDKDDFNLLDFNLDETMGNLQDRIKELEGQMDIDVLYFGKGSGNEEELVQRLKDLSDDFKSNNKEETRIIIISKKIKIKDLDSSDQELKKLGKSDAKKLDLPDFNYYPNPSNGRFTLKFKVENEAPLSVKVYSLSGQEVYGETYDSFSGTYKNTLDLSRQKEGIYLLEISEGNRVLNKKLIIE